MLVSHTVAANPLFYVILYKIIKILERLINSTRQKCYAMTLFLKLSRRIKCYPPENPP